MVFNFTIGQKFQPVSRTDDLAAKRIEKLNDSEKKSCKAKSTFLFRVVQFFNPLGC